MACCRSSFLISGSGLGDPHIRFHDVDRGSGQRVHEIATDAQVSSLAVSADSLQFVSTHGNARHAGAQFYARIVVWSAANMQPIAGFSRHSGRVLSACLGPQQDVLCTASADQTLALSPIWSARTSKAAANKQPSRLDDPDIVR